ncbi:MAG: CoA-binding protein [Anaerovorax sp.]
MKETMLNEKIWAVVGAGKDSKKFGYKIYQRLKEKNYQVYAVNPGLDKIDEDPCYKDLSSLPVVPDVIDMVVAPNRAKTVLEEAAKLGIKNVWFQPGSHDPETVKLAESLGLNQVQACVLVETK